MGRNQRTLVSGLDHRGCRPQAIGHLIEVAEIQRGIARVEPRAAPVGGIEQTAAQCALQQVDAHQRLDHRAIAGMGIGRAAGAPTPAFLPSRLDLAHAFNHKFVIAMVRSAMKPQAQPQGFVDTGRQQQAIAAKIVKTDRFGAGRIEQGPEPTGVEHLARQDMMALQSLRISR